jgi:hypothetical protein
MPRLGQPINTPGCSSLSRARTTFSSSQAPYRAGYRSGPDKRLAVARPSKKTKSARSAHTGLTGRRQGLPASSSREAARCAGVTVQPAGEEWQRVSKFGGVAHGIHGNEAWHDRSHLTRRDSKSIQARDSAVLLVAWPRMAEIPARRGA